MYWTEIKDAIEAATGLERDALHIYTALLIQLGACVLFRRCLADVLPWLCVLPFEVGNEYMDMYTDGLVEQWELLGAAHDLWNTMLLPTAILLITRFAPNLAVRRAAAFREPSAKGAPSELGAASASEPALRG